MSMCRIFSCVVGRGCLLWPEHSLGRTLLAFALLHSILQGQSCLLLQLFLDFLIAKFRLNLKKVGKTTRPFRYDLNQIPYDYTVEVRNRFKGLDLIERVPDELWMEVRDIVQETGIKTKKCMEKKCMEKKCKKAKWLSEEVLQIALKRREAKNKGEKERYTHLTLHSRMSGSRWVITPSQLSWSWRSFLYSSSVYSCHLFLISSASVRSLPFLPFIEPISARKLEIPREHFMQRWAR